MKRLFFLSLLFIFALASTACGSGNTGDFKITLRLPFDEGVCAYYEDYDEEGDDGEESGEDYTYCINKTDQILLSIYSKSDLSDDYVYADRKLIRVTDNKGGKEEFIRSLKKGTYYRFFVEVTNKNEKLKLTGGLDGIYYDNDENYSVDIFLGAIGDFVRVVKDRKEDIEVSSLSSYFETQGSKGSAAAALKDGSLYLSGGYGVDLDEAMDNTMIFNMKALSSKEATKLPYPLYDHSAALLDDGTEKGKIVVAFGTLSEESGYSSQIWLYDPEDDKYSELAVDAPAITKAKTLTIDGDVYIVGGCSADGGQTAVYRVAVAEAGNIYIEKFADLKTGRCNHAVADVSQTNEDGTVVPRILVVGGSRNVEKEGEETPVIGENFAELVVFNNSSPIKIKDRQGGDDSNLMTTGLISSAGTSVIMDDKEKEQAVVTLVGGYLRDGDEDEYQWKANPNLFVFSEEEDGSWTYDVNASPHQCARPSIAALGSEKKNPFKYAAVNCGTKELERTTKSSSDQIIFVLQIKRLRDSNLGKEIFASSVKESLMQGNIDPDSDSSMVDGPMAVNALGQIFPLGGQYIYQISSYAIP